MPGLRKDHMNLWVAIWVMCVTACKMEIAHTPSEAQREAWDRCPFTSQKELALKALNLQLPEMIGFIRVLCNPLSSWSLGLAALAPKYTLIY